MQDKNRIRTLQHLSAYSHSGERLGAEHPPPASSFSFALPGWPRKPPKLPTGSAEFQPATLRQSFAQPPFAPPGSGSFGPWRPPAPTAYAPSACRGAPHQPATRRQLPALPAACAGAPPAVRQPLAYFTHVQGPSWAHLFRSWSVFWHLSPSSERAEESQCLSSCLCPGGF